MINLNFSTALIIILLVFFIPLSSWSQKRIKKPSDCNIESSDSFVDKSFEIYNNVFVYDSLTKVGIKIPNELEDEILENSERNIDSLLGILPDVVDDIANGNASIIKKSRATLNLNKSKRALKYCLKYIKSYILDENGEQ